MNLNHMDALAWIDAIACLLSASMIAMHAFCRLTGLCMPCPKPEKLSRTELLCMDFLSFCVCGAFVFVAARVLGNTYLFPVDPSELLVNIFFAIILCRHRGDMRAIWRMHCE